MGKHQQQYACNDGSVPRIDQHPFTMPVNRTSQQQSGCHGSQRDADEVDASTGQSMSGCIDGHIDLDHSISHHEEKLRDGCRQRHALKQLVQS